MTTICLPQDRQLDLYAGLLVVLVCGLVALCPLSAGAKATGIAAIGLWAALLRRRYVLHRPVSLKADPDGGLLLTQADGRQYQVTGIFRGVVSPFLVSARLNGKQGEFSDLFVPSSAIDTETHWQLRRMLIGFKPAHTADRRGT